MGSIIVACLIMFVFIALLALFTRAYADFWYRVLVSSKLEVINSLMESPEVPQPWRLRLLEKAFRKNPTRFAALIASLVKVWYVFRLKSIIRYIKRSSLIKNQDKQDYLLALHEIQAEWEQGDM